MSAVYIDIATKPSITTETEVTKRAKTKITLFHCANAMMVSSFPESASVEIKTIRMPCSGMTREVFLLRAFEAGADAVLVFVCPEGSCRYVEGNIRARKRVEYTKKLLDEIGLGGERLNIFNVATSDQSLIAAIVSGIAARLSSLGHNPAAQFINGDE